jgi:hypothetical protein
MGVSGFTPRPLYFRETARGSHWIGGWVGHRTGLDAVVEKKNSQPLPEIESHYHPARSTVLYHSANPAPKGLVPFEKCFKLQNTCSQLSDLRKSLGHSSAGYWSLHDVYSYKMHRVLHSGQRPVQRKHVTCKRRTPSEKHVKSFLTLTTTLKSILNLLYFEEFVCLKPPFGSEVKECVELCLHFLNTS